ncbi:LpxL/LpxP family Kdo(2)-lipid IV(A) lauroyl/palmitoleoyl acyltransferase [Endozoicomonadaceae bacterium StTr2]
MTKRTSVADKPEQPEFQLHYLSPRYWGLWLMFGISRLISGLPWKIQTGLGRRLGRLFLRVGGRRRHIAERNIALCFPELDQQQREKFLAKSYESLGIGVLEVGMAWWWSRKRLEDSWELEGLENIEQGGKGIVLLGIHQTCIEMMGATASLAVATDITYRRHKNPFYEYMQRQRRTRFNDCGRKLVDRKDVRTFVRRLKAGKIMWYLPDQDYGPKQSVFAPFMGVNAATVTGAARLCRMTGARVVPISAYRNYETGKYHIKFHPAWEDFPEGDDVRDAVRVNQYVEQIIRQYPEDYYWVHRRFKTRPEGESKLY